MRILRVVTDYWPHWGGNERWSFEHDRWFSEVARDDVRVLVLRHKLLDHPAYREVLARGHEIPGEFVIPELPKVRAFQDFLPRGRNVFLACALHRAIRPWVADSVDLVITQMYYPHAYFAWRGRPVVLELSWPLGCTFAYRNPGCRRTAFMCARCFRQGGLRWWVKDQLKNAMLRRFDLIVGTDTVLTDLGPLSLDGKLYLLRHVVDTREMFGPLSEVQEAQKARVDTLANRVEFVLMQFNRLDNFKNPGLLLEIAEHLPECGVVFAGDGLERPGLEQRVTSSASLRDRVIFLGMVPATCIGQVAERVSAFVMTSVIGNYNTALCETMGLGLAPVVSVDTKDFPPAFYDRELILRASADPAEIAGAIRHLLANPARSRAMVAAARQYVEAHHSPDRMWAYRTRLLRLVERYAGGRGSASGDPGGYSS